jgi:hypothetical protein
LPSPKVRRETRNCALGTKQKKRHGRKSSSRGFIENGGLAPVEKVVRRRPHPEVGAKIESRDGVHTIAFSRSWLNAFFFGVRLAWLSPFPLGLIEVLDLTAFPSAIRTDL